MVVFSICLCLSTVAAIDNTDSSSNDNINQDCSNYYDFIGVNGNVPVANVHITLTWSQPYSGGTVYRQEAGVTDSDGHLRLQKVPFPANWR